MRSTRININIASFCSPRLEKEPNKKRKTSAIVIDGDTGEARPISLEIL
jgi:hypothetical protein